MKLLWLEHIRGYRVRLYIDYELMQRVLDAQNRRRYTGWAGALVVSLGLWALILWVLL